MDTYLAFVLMLIFVLQHLAPRTSFEVISLSDCCQGIHDNREGDAPAEPRWNLWRFAAFRSAGASNARFFEAKSGFSSPKKIDLQARRSLFLVGEYQ
jgi:hypothetical protein